MQKTTKFWVGVGAFLVASTAGETLVTDPMAVLSNPIPAALAAGGEGGETGGEGGGRPASYKLNSTDANAFAFDAAAQINGYAAHVFDSYTAAHRGAKRLQTAIDRFLKSPNATTLADARNAWTSARVFYLKTEAFRFYDGPIDLKTPTGDEEGPEGHINAWPLNEAFIDGVKGNPKSGLVNDRKVPVTRAAILERDQVSDEADVTTGWHAIEFLLWGQDFSATGPGNRPASDYTPGKGNNDRRRTYLKIVTDMLVDDLGALAKAWDPAGKDTYAAYFKALDQREALGRMFAGMASLAGYELMSERLAVALDSGDQEDEHSCFSDTTWQDFLFDIRGIREVYSGGAATPAGASLQALVAQRAPDVNNAVLAALAAVEADAEALPRPFDQEVLRAPKDSEGRKKAEKLVKDLTTLASALADAGAAVGVLVTVPTVHKAE